jgi:two-component sensor histidine kinase
MLHTVSWPAEASPPRPPARLPARFTRCRTGRARWLLALAIGLTAAAALRLIDGYVECGAFLTFLPAVALATVFCGRWQAGSVLVLAVAARCYLWLPAAGFASAWPKPAVSLALFLLVALFELLLVDALCGAAHADTVRQDRLARALRLRETMFREMRHRIANQLHLIMATLEGAQVRIGGGARADRALEQAIGRVSSIAYLQRIVDDKASHARGLAPLLRDILGHVFHDVDVAVRVRVPPVALPDHQLTIICLIVIEAAMNSSKHIFRLRRGCMFAVELRSVADDRLMLTIWDDGPGFDAGGALANADGLGMSIMQDLAAELGGGLTLDSRGGTTVKVEFAGA